MAQEIRRTDAQVAPLGVEAEPPVGSPMIVVQALDVWLNGQAKPLGRLEGLGGMGGYPIRFTYAPDYAGPALSASLPVRFEPYGNSEARIFFDNLLPEGLQRLRVVPPDGAGPFPEDDVAGLLAVLGPECAGAVSVVPSGSARAKRVGNLDEDYDRLSPQEVGRLLAAAARGENPDRRLGLALAGVQRKIALAIDPESGEFLLPNRPGIPTTHILKVQAAGEVELRGIVCNELCCLMLAARLGLTASKATRREFGGIEALVVERFDRRIEGRLVHRRHQEDAAQALGLDRSEKYEDEAQKRGKEAGLQALFTRCAGLTARPAETCEALRKAVFFNWLIANNDAHAKNFALLYPEGWGAPDLAPLYDLVSIEALTDRYRHMSMAIAGVVEPDEVTREGILWLAGLGQQRGGPPRTILGARLAELRAIAETALPTLDALVADGEFARGEVKLIRDVVASRIRHLNGIMGWEIPAEGDAVVRRGGGWALPLS